MCASGMGPETFYSQVIGMHRTVQQTVRTVVEYILFVLQAHQDAMATKESGGMAKYNPPPSKLVFRIFPVKDWG